jgi:hypothetical protein
MVVRLLLSSVVVATGALWALGAPAADAPPAYLEQAPAAYQDCVSHSCKLVPDKKQIKKTVYEVKEVPYCLKRLPPILSLFHVHRGCDQCGACDECQCPRYRKVMVKKEEVCREICTTKCVVEEHVTRVPCVPCQPSCK